MYEIVRTSRQQKEFEETWEYFCNKYNWYNDPYAKNGIRYNLLLPGTETKRRKKIIGTIEFIPYNPTNPHSTVEGPNRFGFSTYEEIRLHQHRTWEIDKLCLHKEYHRRGFFHIFMHVFHNHAKTNSPKYYLALVEKKFFRMLKISFGLGVEQKGEELTGPGTTLVPVVFDIEKMMQDEETVRKLLEMSNHLQKKSSNKGFLKKIFSMV
ncbi:hypothetical protein [Jeotgalibacillus soli]|uniref:N-acetyltransferase domain-containing protein n=1 Tax=Jeotgalibacillus soli TaxID=889306 RepID=A0A0C2VKA2_9BACL|nr:hypothetical protein [Jeotgalibacillus soli]KIL49342.1 hypothetical protein KP78_08100 [Jeotgalibacillus soli]